MRNISFFFVFLLVVFLLAMCYGLQQEKDDEDVIIEEAVQPENNLFTTTEETDKEEMTIAPSPLAESTAVSEVMENPLMVISDLPGILLVRKGYITSYNPDTRCPNWVFWHLTGEHTDGDVPRLNNYFEDEDVPLPRATDDDYRRSGWTHGHMCPAADNKWDEVAMRESCLLTNICPQHGSLNSGLWNTIEGDCRQWARKYGDVYIVCGPVFLNREHETIGENKVVVPEAFFKVILCLQGTPKAIGYVVRNNEGKKKKDQFINTVDEVERITGYDFFPALPDSIEDVVEAYANIKEW